MRIAEKKHYNEPLEANKINMAKQWSIMKDRIGKKRNNQITSCFKSANRILKDKKSIANSFNTYFVNVGPTLAQKIPEQVKKPEDFLVGNYNYSMFLMPITPQEIVTITSSLKNGADGVDGVQMKIIKQVIHEISSPLCHVFNLSFQQGIFPNILKLAKVIPIYKIEDRQIFSNYSPTNVVQNTRKTYI